MGERWAEGIEGKADDGEGVRKRRGTEEERGI